MKAYRRLEKYCCSHQKAIESFLTVLVFFLLCMSIYAKPYVSDDLVYSLKWGSTEALSSVHDIIVYQSHMYLEWGGRTVAHSILQLLFLIGKPWSSMLTALAYFGLTAMICRSAGLTKRVAFFLVLGALYFLNPAFEETVLWYTGSANYLWTMLIVLTAFQPFLKLYQEGKMEKSAMRYAPLAFLAGWCNENISTTLVLVAGFILFKDYQRKKAVNWEGAVLLLLMAAGCAFLVFAPGNYVRAGTFSSGLMSIAYRGHGQVNAWCNWLFPAWMSYVIARYMLYRRNILLPSISRLFAIWAVFSILIMAVSPSYPERATFGSLVFIVIAVAAMLKEVYGSERRLIDCLGICTAIAFSGCLLSISLLQMVRNSGVSIPG